MTVALLLPNSVTLNWLFIIVLSCYMLCVLQLFNLYLSNKFDQLNIFYKKLLVDLLMLGSIVVFYSLQYDAIILLDMYQPLVHLYFFILLGPAIVGLLMIPLFALVFVFYREVIKEPLELFHALSLCVLVFISVNYIYYVVYDQTAVVMWLLAKK
jgi:hypothetical protein